MRTRRYRACPRRASPAKAGASRPPFGTRLALGLALSLGACGPGRDQAPRSEPSIELSECSAGVAEARCGVLEVEERRDAPNGHRVPLAIVVVPASERTAAPDPVFVLAGGPGQGAAELAGKILHPLEPIRRERDLVFVDVRGTGSSDALKCKLEDPENLELTLAARVDLEQIDDCLASYPAHTDPRNYTTAAIVDDLDEVRAALGYDQVNVLAISYGTRVAQVWMRRHGASLRSVILDGVVPLDVEVYPQIPANTERALRSFLAECREDSTCAAAFPGLERKLGQVLTELETNRALEEFDHPRTGEAMRVDLTRAGFAQILAGTMYSAELATLLPWIIERAHAGDYGPSVAMSMRLGMMSETLSMGLYLSVACSEDLDRLDAARRSELTEGLELFDDHALAQLEQACARWPHATLSAEDRAPLRSAVPSLLLSGALDPVTPAAYGEHLAAQLDDARHVVVDAVHHGVWHAGCAPKLLAGFFADPRPGALDPSCLEALERPAPFVSANAPRPRISRDQDPAPAALESLAPRLATHEHSEPSP